MRQRVIGLVMPHGHAYYREILRGIAEFANHQPGWCFLSAAPEINRNVRELLRHVDAVIMGLNSREWCDLALKSRARVVNIDCVVPDLPIPRVGVDNLLVGRLAARHFLERGLRSFAFIGHGGYLYSMERCEGFRAELHSAGHALSTYLTPVSGVFDVTGCIQQLDSRVSSWLKSLSRPCGVFTDDDSMAADVISLCNRIGVHVPEHVAVMGVDNDDLYCQISRPRLSSVIVPATTLGFLAARETERLISRNRRFMSRDLFVPPPGVAIRRSTDILAIDNPDVIAAIRFVRENSHRRLCVSDVLRVMPVSRRSLERGVLEALGTTLGAEIRRSRLELARRLLAESDMPISKVAAQSGFTDFRHLAVTFRRELGQTPTQYRRLLSPRRT